MQDATLIQSVSQISVLVVKTAKSEAYSMCKKAKQ